MSTSVVACGRCGRRNRVPAAAEGIPRCGQCHAPLPWVADAGDDDFADLVERSTIPVLVDMWAPWCAPCRAVSPALQRLAGELAGRLKLVKVNVDDAPKLAQRFSVMAVPTLVVMSRGQEVVRQAGAAPVTALRTWLERAMEAV